MIDNSIRNDFPILNSTVNGHALIYLDNAATTQVPSCVLETLSQHYSENNANIHRGIHSLSERSTKAYEDARSYVKDFINAESPEEIIFTHGTTESVNMVAFGLSGMLRSDEGVIVSALEHHSNFLPWQRLCRECGAKLYILPCPDGDPDIATYKEMLSCHPKIVALTQVSNLTGTVFPIAEMTKLAHDAGALVLIDGAQGIRHEITDVLNIGCDYYCFSGHKILAPAGIGVLYGRKAALKLLKPMLLGGGMVDTVTAEGATFSELPLRLEAGTPNYSGAIALAAALNYITRTGREDICRREAELTAYAQSKLETVDNIKIIASPSHRAGVISFNLRKVHPYDAAALLDKLGIALRSGTHCAQPALTSFGIEYALRMSPAFYNTKEEIDTAVSGICRVASLLAY